MQDAKVGNKWPESQVPAAMFESLRELNHHFLDLIGISLLDWNASNRAGLPREMCERIAPLSEVQRRAAADCPYALFDLRFADESFWCARLQGAGPWCVSEAASVDSHTSFARLALFFAWHVAANGKLAAQLLLGMSEATIAAFRGVTIGSLSALAATEAPLLTARWSGCPAFWRALTRAAARQNLAALRRVQLCGLQLAAAARLA